MLRKFLKTVKDKISTIGDTATSETANEMTAPQAVTKPEEESPIASKTPPAPKSAGHRSSKQPGTGKKDSPEKKSTAVPNAKPGSSPKPKTSKSTSVNEVSASTTKGKPVNPPKPKWNLSQFQVEPAEGKVRFHDLDLPSDIMHGIFDLGFEYCTPIQAGTLPQTLTGKDAAGKAQTGTGKSAAFLITMLNHIKRNPIKETREPGTPRALIMVPTRELALQVQKDANNLGKYSRCRVVSIFGGMDYQKQKLLLADKFVDIMVATPGRLLDFQQQGLAKLGKVEILVIDEADQMLDMGFIPDIRKIVRSTPPKTQRQTMLFGATLTPEVTKLASQWTHDPINVEIEPDQVAVDTVSQMVYLITTRERFKLLYNMITQQNLERVIVFCNRRDQTRRLAEKLQSYGLSCAALSGEVAQKKRIRTLEDFRSGKISIMVSTDVAGRGIHIEGISHVVNYTLPLDPEDYVHRIGRTGRAGATGTSVSFATEDESFQLPAIEKFLGEKLHCVYPEAALLTSPPPPTKESIPVKPRPKASQPKRQHRTPARKPPQKD